MAREIVQAMYTVSFRLRNGRNVNWSDIYEHIVETKLCHFAGNIFKPMVLYGIVDYLIQLRWRLFLRVHWQ